MHSTDAELNALFTTCSDPAARAALRKQALAQVVRWRWASESMSFDAPFARELYGGAAPRWLADDKAKPADHVHHGIDAEGRIVIERSAGRTETIQQHAAQQRAVVGTSDGGLDSVQINRYRDGRLLSDHLRMRFGSRGIDTRYIWEGEHLLRSVMRNWSDDKTPWFCQYLFTHGADGELDRIDLQYLDEQGQVQPGHDRLHYLRLPKGETLKTVEARVQTLLLQALPDALARIPRDDPLYALLLCFTNEDLPAAWPPFLVWGTESYRRQTLAVGKDVPYHLWAPDEIRGDHTFHELWLDGPEHQDLRDACLLHSQLMGMKQSDASAMRVLKAIAPELEAMALPSGLPLTDDFAVAVADNTGEIDPLKALKARLTPERWALLKARGWV